MSTSKQLFRCCGKCGKNLVLDGRQVESFQSSVDYGVVCVTCIRKLAESYDPTADQTFDITLADDLLLPLARVLLKKLHELQVRGSRMSTITLFDSEVTTITVTGTTKDDHVMIFQLLEDEEDEDG